MKPKKPKNSLNKYLKLTGIAVQMGVTIYLAVYVGKKLDLAYPNQNNWYTLIFTLIGLIVAFYAVLVQTKKLNE